MMETQQVSPAKFAITYGIILGVIFILINVVLYVTGMALEGVQWPQYLFYLIFPGVIIYAISLYKQKNANLLALGEAVKIGVVAGLISAIVYIIYSLIFTYIIDPGFMAQLMDSIKDKMLEQNPDMTEEMAEQGMKFVRIFTNPFISSAFWIFMSGLFGLIYGLIGGAVMKKENTHA